MGFKDSSFSGRCGPVPSGVQVSTVTFHCGMSVSVVAGADAFGVDTLASVDTTISVVDRGLLTYATGASSAIAAATAPDGAFATSYAQLGIGGADYAHVATQRAEAMDEWGRYAASTVELGFFAFDCKWLDGGVETRVETLGPAGEPSISGNLATFTAALEAEGDNSFVDLRVDAISLEDQLSSTTMSAIAAVDGDVTYRHYVGTTRSEVITTTAEAALVEGGRGNDKIISGAANDWLFGGEGSDQITAGAGDDTAFGDAGNDRLLGGDGMDWLFGGRGDDTIYAGADDDVVFGGEGRDTIEGGSGNDLIDAGGGSDTARGGSGDDVFRLGSNQPDGNDKYWGDDGADLYLIAGGFGTDVIADFSLAQGDRLLVPFGNWESDASLRQLNGAMVTLQRGTGDADDLVLNFDLGSSRSRLTLDEFFRFNPGYSAMPRRGEFSDADALALLRDLFGNDLGTFTQHHQSLLELGQFLSEMG